MTIPRNFRIEMKKQLSDNIEIVLDNPDLELYKRTWHTEHVEDFLYGWILGRADTFITSIFLVKMKRSPNPDEMQDIRELLAEKSSEIRNRLGIT